MNKKGDVKLIIGIALAIFILLLLISISSRGANTWKSATEDCKGACRDSCNIDEIQSNKKCVVGGKEQEGVCCIGVNTEQQKPGETTQPPPDKEEENVATSPITTKPSFVLIQGEGTKIQSGTINIYTNRETSFKVEKQNQGILKCRAYTIDIFTKDKITESTNTFYIPGENCDFSFDLTKGTYSAQQVGLRIGLWNNSKEEVYQEYTLNIQALPQQ